MPIYQSKFTSFFNTHHVLHPWPNILRRDKFKYLYKPREVWWNFWITKLCLEKGNKVLEVGCGRGIFLDRLKAKFDISGAGVDIASDAIYDAKKESVYKQKFICADAVGLPFRNNQFDAVLSFDTLEHVKDQEKVINEMARVLKPKGKLLLYTINSKQKYTWNNLLSRVGFNVYSEVDHDPKLFVDPQWLEKILKNNNIEHIKLGYFNAFFTLIADEAIMTFLKYWQKFLGWRKTGRFAMMILGVLTLFSKLTTRPLMMFDALWTNKNYSNGIIVMGQKV